jgi:hypothetical protein
LAKFSINLKQIHGNNVKRLIPFILAAALSPAFTKAGTLRLAATDSITFHITLDKSTNSVYRGLPNPVTVVVPNAVLVDVQGDGLIKLGDGHYNLQPGSGKRCKVIVRATMPDGNVFQHSKYFEIRNVPAPIPLFNGVAGDNPLAMVREEVASGTISVGMSDFDYDLTFSVTAFSIKFPDKRRFEVKGNRFNNRAMRLLKKCKPGSGIEITGIKTTNSSGSIIPAQSAPLRLIIK